MPDYKTHDPKGWCGNPSRGAALGRPTICDVDPLAYVGPIQIVHKLLDSGGYDENGTYFGGDDNLFWYASEDGDVDGMLRAKNHDDAEERLRNKFPRAAFTRPDDEPRGIAEFLHAYADMALNSAYTYDSDDSEDENAEPRELTRTERENIAVCDIEPETMANMRKDCLAFLAKHAEHVRDVGFGVAGEYFYYTRNRAGIGFWDDEYPWPNPEELQATAHEFGESPTLFLNGDKVSH